MSHHPFFLEEFRKLLSTGKVRTFERRLDTVSPAGMERLSIPRASVCVVDGHGTRPMTEALVSCIRRKSPRANIVLVAEKFNDGTAFPMLRLGVKALLSYAEAVNQLPRVLPTVAAGGFWVPRYLLSRFVESMISGDHTRQSIHGSARLSRREQVVLDALLQNLANKEIAQNLNLSERTVKFHVSNVLAKFGVRRRADVFLLSQSRGAIVQ